MMMMMAEGGDNKTEKPTAHKLQKAREQGQVARSADVTSMGLLGVALLLFSYFGGYWFASLQGLLSSLLSLPAVGPTHVWNLETAMGLLRQALWVLGLLLVPFMGSMVLGAVGLNLMQVRFLWSTQLLTPKLERISPASGWKRMASPRSAVELVKGLLKLGLIGGIGLSLLWGLWASLGPWMDNDSPSTWLPTFWQYLQRLWVWLWGPTLLLALADWRYQAHAMQKQLSMSRQDIRDEAKNLDGDQKMKQKIKALGQRMLNKKQLAQVPKADVIITNPTHYAVALRYDPDIAPAPHVVAKGIDFVALKIREVAKTHRVEIVENRALARGLHAQVDVGEMIPPELFVAVAEVLAFVYAKRGGRR
jgi:flagellar biosynthetic protein FlhB